MSGEQWESAPEAVVESIQQWLSGEGGGEGGECVMVRGGGLVRAECSEERRHVCLYTYPGESDFSPSTADIHKMLHIWHTDAKLLF